MGKGRQIGEIKDRVLVCWCEGCVGVGVGRVGLVVLGN